jgi:hypothetical protein
VPSTTTTVCICISSNKSMNDSCVCYSIHFPIPDL